MNVEEKTKSDRNVEERAEISTANQDLHPREDLSHGDEGIDDPLRPEDATSITTTDDGEPANQSHHANKPR